MFYVKGFNFSKLNDIMDFYLITFCHFNDCFDELLYGGTTPLNSDNSDIKTLVRFVSNIWVKNMIKNTMIFAGRIWWFFKRLKNRKGKSVFRIYDNSYDNNLWWTELFALWNIIWPGIQMYLILIVRQFLCI
jgi:hypothetical protein